MGIELGVLTSVEIYELSLLKVGYVLLGAHYIEGSMGNFLMRCSWCTGVG